MIKSVSKATRDGDEALREANQRLQRVLDSIADGLAVLDKDWRYTYMNEQGARIIGMRPEELLGKVVWELFPFAQETKFYEGYHRAVATGERVQFEEFYPEPLNLWLECRCYPSTDGLSIYFHDITGRKHAEAILRQNEGLFAALVNQAPTGVYVVDAEFRLQQINTLAMPAFARVEPKIGRDFAEVMNILWGPEVGRRLSDIFRHTLKTGEPFVSPRFSEYRQDLGVEKAYEWQTQRVTLPDGQHGVVCYFNDITERIQSEQALLQAKAAAEAANRSKDQFLAALSHELRTPLNPALLIASASAENPELPEAVRSDFKTIRKNIELEARLIDDLLDLTRVLTGKMPLHLTFVDVHDILVDALTTIQTEQQEKNILLFVNFKARVASVKGDAARLQQIFWNVLKNAVKFTPPDGQINVETFENAGRLVVKIADSGIGMSQDELGRIFSAFAQGDHAQHDQGHRFGGLGLGLSISRKLVELHSGRISAQSDGINRGSVFLVELPLASQPLDAAGAALKSSKPEGNDLPGQDLLPWRILLVEDHDATRTVLAQLLTWRKYHVVAAATIAKARTVAQSQKFDLLISDIGLPDGSGNDLMKELFENYGLRGIALTGYGMEEDIARGKAAGFITHLIKPVRIESLEHALTMVKNVG